MVGKNVIPVFPQSFSFLFFYPATNPSTASMVYRALLMFVVISEISRWCKSHIGKKHPDFWLLSPDRPVSSCSFSLACIAAPPHCWIPGSWGLFELSNSFCRSLQSPSEARVSSSPAWLQRIKCCGAGLLCATWRRRAAHSTSQMSHLEGKVLTVGIKASH